MHVGRLPMGMATNWARNKLLGGRVKDGMQLQLLCNASSISSMAQTLKRPPLMCNPLQVILSGIGQEA